VGWVLFLFASFGNLTEASRRAVDLVALGFFLAAMAWGFAMAWRFRPERGSMPPRQ
jgi:hypothetical protein